MEKMQWFKFSPADWLMGKIQRVPDDVKVRFIGLVCLYWNKGCELSIEDAAIELDENNLDLLLSKKIIKQVNGFVKISFLDEQMTNVKTLSESRKEAANKRWANKTSANGMQLHEVALQNDADKIRQEETREDKRRKELENMQKRKLSFASTCQPFILTYGEKLVNDFIEYWTEPNKSMTKFKQESEKTWDVSRRIKKWAENDSKFNSNKTKNNNLLPHQQNVA